MSLFPVHQVFGCWTLNEIIPADKEEKALYRLSCTCGAEKETTHRAWRRYIKDHPCPECTHQKKKEKNDPLSEAIKEAQTECEPSDSSEKEAAQAADDGQTAAGKETGMETPPSEGKKKEPKPVSVKGTASPIVPAKAQVPVRPKLSALSALLETRAMWRWIAKHTAAEGKIFTKKDYFDHKNVPEEIRPVMNSEICEYDDRFKNPCTHCGILWTDAEDMSVPYNCACVQESSPYHEWKALTEKAQPAKADIERAGELAKQIAELPANTNVKGLGDADKLETEENE